MSHSGAAVYKKVSGMLNIEEESSPAILLWRSTDGDKSHKILLNTIDKLQATPATNDKMMLRLVGKVDNSKKQKNNEGEEVVSPPPFYLFSFNNRTVMDNLKETLQHIIARYKDEEVYEEKKRKEASSSSTPQPQQNATSLINTSSLDDSLTHDKLLVNLKLQQSLLKENKPLMKIFQETVINSGLPPQEFWSTRVPLLRAFALATSQRIGPYNVLSTIKPVASSDNKVNVSVSREKILTIFNNYPIVKKAYDDNVPKNFKEQEFWARFFSSKLFRKLRGERIMQNDRGDMIIDRYLTLDQEFDRKDDEMLLHPVKKLIDLEGNDQDDPERRGNRPDLTMLPGTDVNGNSDGVVDILKGMNRLSEKMVKSLENEYSRANLLSQDLDREEREELMFSDLVDDHVTKYAEIHLNQKAENDQKLPGVKEDSPLQGEKLFISNEEIRRQVGAVVDGLLNSIELTKVSRDDDDTNNLINKRVIKAVKINAKQAKHNHFDSVLGAFLGNSNTNDSEAESQLPTDLLESCRVLHGTCCEFLKHFYIHFQSGELKQGNLVKKLYSYLKACLNKIQGLLQQVDSTEKDQSTKNEVFVKSCKAYLSPVMESVNLAIRKYEFALSDVEDVN